MCSDIFSEKIMNKFVKIFFLVLVILFTSRISSAQTEFQQKDTLNLKVKKSESAGNSEKQNAEGEKNTANKGNTYTESQTVKQVKAARPDMSKARGARPPDIVRPGGSRIPNGIGKPSGALRPGHG
jgi:hypothetical protein